MRFKRLLLLESKEDHTEEAIKEFGITYKIKAAAYILKDGRLLDFGEGTDMRGDDHRAISRAMEDLNFDTQSEYLIAFMNEGNIRLIPEMSAIDISTKHEPTPQQYKTIERVIRQLSPQMQSFTVDISDERGNNVGNMYYEGKYIPVNLIITNIKKYFQGDESVLSSEDDLDDQW